MKINETVTKSFTFYSEDALALNKIVLHQFGKKTIKTVLEHYGYYLPMLSAYGKITNNIGMGYIKFTWEERNYICDVLRTAWKDETLDQDTRDKALEMLKGIFDNA